MKRPVQVVVIDDHEIVRMGLRSILDREPDINVIGTAASGEDGLELVEEVCPDLAVIDYSMPGMSGAEVCWHLTRRFPQVNVVMLTTFLDDAVIRQSLEAGAKAYVYKDVEGAELKRAIRNVARGEAVLHPKVTERVMHWAQVKSTREAPLSPRETDVLRLVAKGGTNREIAAELNVSINTVKTCLSRALRKLGCSRRSQAASVAAKRGLL